ncbi:hypothetical protein B484DRAFT_268301 [Ochromonadaceae sp. CCMP2298]|nr:hypothetical protein B484DRAFT_268301 [Ochromonadaceae sp. CCMP2298]
MRREWESAEMRLGESAEALEQAQAAVVEISTELDLAERALAKAEANTASTSASTSDPSSASDSAPTSTSAPVDTDVALAVTDAVRFVEHREAILSLELRLVEATAAAENAQVDAELLGEELRLKEQRVQILTEEIGGMEEEHAKETEALREESDRLKHNDEGDARQIAQLSGVCKLQAEQLANLEGELEVAQKELRALEVAVSAAELESAEWKLPSLRLLLPLTMSSSSRPLPPSSAGSKSFPRRLLSMPLTRLITTRVWLKLCERGCRMREGGCRRRRLRGKRWGGRWLCWRRRCRSCRCRRRQMWAS